MLDVIKDHADRLVKAKKDMVDAINQKLYESGLSLRVSEKTHIQDLVEYINKIG